MRNNQLKRKRMLIRHFDEKNPIFLMLYGIYNQAIDPELTYSKFVKMYVTPELLEIDFTIFFDGQIRAGFSAAFFYATVVNGKKGYVVRSATGLLEAYQGKGLHSKADLYFKFIRFAVKHPVSRIWICAFVINAFVFKDLCKFVPEIFPAPGKLIPDHIQRVIDEILGSGDHKPDALHPLSCEVPIQVSFNKTLLGRILESNDPNVQWYLKANPGFLEKFGLLVIIEVSAKNISGTLYRLFMHSMLCRLARSGNTVKSYGKSLKQKTITLVDLIAKKRIL